MGGVMFLHANSKSQSENFLVLDIDKRKAISDCIWVNEETKQAAVYVRKDGRLVYDQRREQPEIAILYGNFRLFLRDDLIESLIVNKPKPRKKEKKNG
jgi:hypothetical protein